MVSRPTPVARSRSAHPEAAAGHPARAMRSISARRASNSSATCSSSALRAPTSDVGVAEDAHLLVSLAIFGTPETDVLDHRDDASEEPRAVLLHESRLRACTSAHSSHRQAERLPHLLGLEAIAHQVAGLDGELLALVALGSA